MEKIVYRSGVNTFYELDNAYKLVDRKGKFAILDKDEKLLMKIIELLQGERSFYFNEGNGAFYLNIYENGRGKYYCSLRQLVVAFNMDGDFEQNLNTVKNNTVLLVNDKEDWNLKRSNLEFTGIDNNVNTFYSDGKNFFIRHNKTGYVVKTDSDKDLNELIRQYRWSYSEGCKTLGTFLSERKNQFISIHRFVREYFDRCNDNMDMESWNRVMKNLSHKAEINVDHLDSDKTNSCKNNLVWMKACDNIRKGNLTKKLNQDPFHCKVLATKYGIRMEAGYVADGNYFKVISNYENPADFVEALRQFWKCGVLCDDAGKEYKLPNIPYDYFREVKKARKYQFI